MIKVGVIFGGESVEHEVSIISAIQAMNKLDREKYEIIPIYITKDRKWYTGEILKEMETYRDMSLLKRYTKRVVLYEKDGRFVLQSLGFFKREIAEIDLAFPIVHGTNVEDGILQGYLHSINIPCVGSSVRASALAQDKVFQKQIWQDAKIPIVKYDWFYDNEFLEKQDEIIKRLAKLKYPMIVKPSNLGSSVGIEVAQNKEELILAIERAIEYDEKIIVEELIENLQEVNIAVLGNNDFVTLSSTEEVMSDNDILTYQDKYLGSSKKTGIGSKGMLSATRKIPAELSDKMNKELEDIATRSFKSLGLSSNVRMDFLIDKKTKKIYINEVNAIPGSLAFYLWEAKGKDFSVLLDDMINLALRDYKKKKAKLHSFETNILEGYSGLKGSKGTKGKL